MYKSIIRPLLFLFSPEFIHHVIVFKFKYFASNVFVSSILRKIFSYHHPILKTNFCGLAFKNPVGLAAGFDKNAEVYNQFSDLGFGYIEVGTVTPKAQPGNPKPRLFRLKKDQALINRMGFNNNGLDAAYQKLSNKNHNVIIGANIGKNTATDNDKAVEDYALCFEKLYSVADYFVVNVSCPNIKDLGKLADTEKLAVILNRMIEIRSTQLKYKPVLLKIAHDLTNEQLDNIVELFDNTSIDGLVVSNTSTSRKGLSESPQHIENIGNGGLSGKPLTERSTEMIRYINQKSGGKIPMMGVGGIMCVKDALDKIEAGATLIQLYTGFIYEGPFLVKKINKAIVKHRLQYHSAQKN